MSSDCCFAAVSLFFGLVSGHIVDFLTRKSFGSVEFFNNVSALCLPSLSFSSSHPEMFVRSSLTLSVSCLVTLGFLLLLLLLFLSTSTLFFYLLVISFPLLSHI